MIHPYNSASCIKKLYRASEVKPDNQKVVITTDPFDVRLNPPEHYSYPERQRALEQRLSFV